MNKCIYCLNGDEARCFSSQDHILLKTLGGQRKLPKNFVCNECNNAFSVLEKRFVLDSPITLPKQFMGPSGRSGKSKSNLHVMIDNTTGAKFIGYIQEGGNPKAALQIQLQGEELLLITEKSEYSEQEQISRFRKLLTNTKKKDFHYLSHDLLDDGTSILCLYKQKIFIFANTESDKNAAIKLAETLLDSSIPIQDGIMKEAFGQITSCQRLSFNIDDWYRVVCKMVFNAVANFFGQEEMLKSKYDPLRRYVRYGTKSINFVATGTPVNKLSEIFTPLCIVKEKENNHFICVGNLLSDKGIIGFVSLYDGHFEWSIRASQKFSIDTDDIYIRVLINNYKSKTEFEIFEKMIKEENDLRTINRG